MTKKRTLHKKIIAASMLTLLLSMAERPVSAWNPYGHMVVAYVAYQKLTAKTKARAIQLLSLNPYYESWTKQIGPVKSQDELDLKIFMLAATWPDVIKGDKSFNTDGTMGGFRPSGRSAGQNTGYSDKNLHMYWHFYDEPLSNDKTILPKIPAPNAETQMQAFRAALVSDAADELKSYDLIWIMHLVGDIHQPLHCVTRVSAKYHEGDNGGNLVKLSCTDCPPNLHSFWDSALGSSGDPKVMPDQEKVIATASDLAMAKKKSSNNLNVDAWINESFKLAKNSIYKPLGKGNGPFDLNDKYKHQAKKLAKKQGELAGERLANLLNRELK